MLNLFQYLLVSCWTCFSIFCRNIGVVKKFIKSKCGWVLFRNFFPSVLQFLHHSSTKSLIPGFPIRSSSSSSQAPPAVDCSAAPPIAPIFSREKHKQTLLSSFFITVLQFYKSWTSVSISYAVTRNLFQHPSMSHQPSFSIFMCHTELVSEFSLLSCWTCFSISFVVAPN